MLKNNLLDSGHSAWIEFINNFWINRYTNFASFWMHTEWSLQQMI